MNILQLIDMESLGWRKVKYNPCDHWRATTPYRCSTCGCISNHFWHPKFCGSPLLRCPGRKAKEELHGLLEKKVRNLDEGHPKNYIKELYEEIVEIRRQFSDVLPDVEMIGDSWKFDNITGEWGQG